MPGEYTFAWLALNKDHYISTMWGHYIHTLTSRVLSDWVKQGRIKACGYFFGVQILLCYDAHPTIEEPLKVMGVTIGNVMHRAVKTQNWYRLGLLFLCLFLCRWSGEWECKSFPWACADWHRLTQWRDTNERTRLLRIASATLIWTKSWAHHTSEEGLTYLALVIDHSSQMSWLFFCFGLIKNVISRKWIR